MKNSTTYARLSVRPVSVMSDNSLLNIFEFNLQSTFHTIIAKSDTRYLQEIIALYLAQ